MDPLQVMALAYALVINISGLTAAYSDKQKARQGRWRISEKSFLLFSLAGGGVGVLLGFLLFRHKTRHLGLLSGVIVLTVLVYGSVIAVLFLLS